LGGWIATKMTLLVKPDTQNGARALRRLRRLGLG
jgi:hypothetical protein